MKSYKKVFEYVGEPNSIKIIAQDSNINRLLDVKLFVNNKEALHGSYKIKYFTQEEANDKVVIFCNAIFMYTEDEIQDWVEADKIMLALYAYRHIKQVRTRSGGSIWKRS